MGNYEIGKDVIITSKIMRRYIDGKVDCGDISASQGIILGMIICAAEEGRDLYQRDIESSLHIRGASVTNILQLMEKKGLVMRVRSESDSRLKKLLPTEEGTLIDNRIRSNIRHADEELQSRFTEEELSVFKSVMERLREFASE